MTDEDGRVIWVMKHCSPDHPTHLLPLVHLSASSSENISISNKANQLTNHLFLEEVEWKIDRALELEEEYKSKLDECRDHLKGLICRKDELLEATSSIYTKGYLTDDENLADSVEGVDVREERDDEKAMDIEIEEVTLNIHRDVCGMGYSMASPNASAGCRSNGLMVNLMLADAINNMYRQNNACKMKGCKQAK